MAKKDPDLDALGRQYREARGAIAPHRQRQADAEVAHGRLARRLGPDHPDTQAAWQTVGQAAADVRWCQAVTVAAGEAFKGVPFDDVPNGPRPTAEILAAR